jgi:hypothetical protein
MVLADQPPIFAIIGRGIPAPIIRDTARWRKSCEGRL